MTDSSGRTAVRRALISVSDRTGLADLARFLVNRGITLTATGGTGGYLRSEGLPVERLESISRFRELLGGRVKSLHPAVHAAILADRNDADHGKDLESLGALPFDLVVGGLYAFESIASGAWSAAAREAVDIGGPAMIRAAAKNHEWVTVVFDPAHYGELINELRSGNGTVSHVFRRRMAAAAFSRTAAYDAAVAAALTDEDFPEQRILAVRRIRHLRYGENPDQKAAFYGVPPFSGLAAARQLAGSELGYNNITDADAARSLVSEFNPAAEPACAIIKHGAPCGAARGGSLSDAFEKARAADPVSAFGGVIGLNRELDADTAERIAARFFELVIAAGADEAAVRVMKQNGRIRLITAPAPEYLGGRREMRSVSGGILEQESGGAAGVSEWKAATEIRPEKDQRRDLEFAWKVAKHARSNAVVVAAAGRTLGIGSGRTSRLDAAEAASKPLGELTDAGLSPVAASDGFFPFADGVEALAAAGVKAIVQPGGSKRDSEIVAAADRLGIAMVLTGRRQFRH